MSLFSDDSGDPFGLPPLPAAGQNAPAEMTVSELSQKLKRTVEENFSYVRLRGEISKVTLAKSGHLYTALKDAAAVIDAVCWKGTVARLGIKPEEGMDVVVTGRLTTYPARSNYQLVIETMELAGQGALLKMLEERKRKLAAEGLFDPARKKPLPFLPGTIGVVTSPTGAVIRDILHRLSDRFPRRVLVWPVMVQGKGAAEQVAAAIEGFNKLEGDLRPDLLIVARGGGSFEDLLPFSEEIVVRAAAASAIPLISAVGHETDTTLIDYAADYRAPTPTAAAERAVPVRAELLARLREAESRLSTSALRRLETPLQRLDHASLRLDRGLEAWIEKRASRLREMAARISASALMQRHGEAVRHLGQLGERLIRAGSKIVEPHAQRAAHLAAMLQSLSFERVLERGFALVTDENGKTLTTAKAAQQAHKLHLRFVDGGVKAVTEES